MWWRRPSRAGQTRQDVAERWAPHVRKLFDEHPALQAPHIDAPHGEAFARKTIGKALRDLYNPAQLDVLRRVDALLAEPPANGRLP